MKGWLFLCVFLMGQASFARQIALSFDDAPRRLTGHFTHVERAKALIKQLKEAGVQDAAFFCNSEAINDQTREAIELYDRAGFTIANHTHSHPSLNKSTLAEYRQNFLTAHKKLSTFKNFKRLFRFPYLREGNTLPKRDGMRAALKEMNYTNAYVTVDFNDWHVEHLYRQSLANKEKVDLNKLRDLYISLAKESLEYAEGLSQKYAKRSVKHVMLLHETDVAALFIKDLVKAMEGWGWTIISPEEAYADPIAQFEFPRLLKNNPGRLGEIAIHNNHPMKDAWSPATYPDYITKRYNNEVLKTSVIR